MKKYIMKRGTGKTTKMVEFAGITNGILIVPSDASKHIAEERAKELGYENVMVVVANSIDSVVSILRGIEPHRLDNVFVDEATSVLAALLPVCNIRAISLSEID